jgi:tetratricopeptide (TPR) repeat protein
LNLSQNDLYWRTRSALFTTQFATLAKDQSPDKAALQAAFSQAEKSASAAVAWDKGSANNWLTLSQVYQLVSSDSSTEAYSNAKVAADQAQARNPNNPVLLLNQAQLALTKSDTQGALAFIDQALSLKADYLDAYVLRAQIKSAQGDNGAAKDALTAYTKVAPLDAQGFVLLGQVYAGAKEYQSAVEAFGQAQHLAPNDPNVAVSYINALVLVGQKTQAIEFLKVFKLKYPGVTGVDEQIKQFETPVAPVIPAATAPGKKK